MTPFVGAVHSDRHAGVIPSALAVGAGKSVYLTLGQLGIDSNELLHWRRPYSLSEAERVGLRALFIKAMGEKRLSRHLHVPLMIPLAHSASSGMTPQDRCTIAGVLDASGCMLSLSLAQFRTRCGVSVSEAIRLSAELEARHVNGVSTHNPVAPPTKPSQEDDPAELMTLLRSTLVHRYLREGLSAADAERRWQVFRCRHIAPGIAQRMWSHVGRRFALSSKQTRLICQDVVRVLSQEKNKLIRLDQAINRLSESCMVRIDTVSAVRTGQDGTALGLEALRCVHSQIFVPAPEPTGTVRLQRADSSHLGEVALKLLRACAEAECAAVGCASLIRLRGLMALDHDLNLGRHALVEIVTTWADAIFLDGAKSWFTLPAAHAGSFASRMVQLQRSASGPLCVDELVADLLANQRWLVRRGQTDMVLPPRPILQSMLSRWPCGSAHETLWRNPAYPAKGTIWTSPLNSGPHRIL